MEAKPSSPMKKEKKNAIQVENEKYQNKLQIFEDTQLRNRTNKFKKTQTQLQLIEDIKELYQKEADASVVDQYDGKRAKMSNVKKLKVVEQSSESESGDASSS